MFRRYVLIDFNLENDLSAVATVTWHRVKQKKLIFPKKIAIWSLLVGPQGLWALVHRTTCTTCMAATATRASRVVCHRPVPL